MSANVDRVPQKESVSAESGKATTPSANNAGKSTSTQGDIARERPDLQPLRRQLTILVIVIAITVVALLALTVYLYYRFTAGVRVTP